jgi:hypothetical protein
MTVSGQSSQEQSSGSNRQSLYIFAKLTLESLKAVSVAEAQHSSTMNI